MKKIGGYVYKNLLVRRKILHPKFEIHDLVGTAKIKRTFSEGDTTNWFCKLYKINENVKDTIQTSRIDILKERYIEIFLENFQLSLKKNISVMKKLNLT